jgi:hypothetical protein
MGRLDLANSSQPILKLLLNLEAKILTHVPSQSVMGL